jgi:hypothetical protein
VLETPLGFPVPPGKLAAIASAFVAVLPRIPVPEMVVAISIAAAVVPVPIANAVVPIAVAATVIAVPIANAVIAVPIADAVVSITEIPTQVFAIAG